MSNLEKYSYIDSGKAASRPGIREVAERAGVAMSSVSRVLSDHPDVSPRMRTIVMAAVEDVGYHPNLLAQGLRRGRTFSVGFTVSHIGNPVLAQVVTGAEKRLRDGGYSLLLTSSEGDAELDAQHIRLLERRRVDGLLLSLAEENHPATVQALRGVEIPIVLIDRDIPAGVQARAVAFDHRAGMEVAARHLLELGHRDVALIIGGPERPARERRQALEETLASGGGRCRPYHGEFSAEYGARAIREILAQRERPTAIIAAGNMLMQGALLSLRDAGIELGRDLSFIGCDDLAITELHQPQIAIVRRDMHAIGTAAAELLIAELDGRPVEEEVILPTEFVARPSCARIA